jgi:hypothetical protein
VPATDVIATTPGLPTTFPDEEDPNSVFAADRIAAMPQPPRSSGFRLVSASIAAPAPSPMPMLAPATDPGPSVPSPTTWSPAPADWTPWVTGVAGPAAVDAPGPGPWDEALGASPFHKRMYLSAEYILWWVKGEQTPVLLTTSAPSDFGILGNPTTRILFGGNSINEDARSGARFMAGWWLDCQYSEALEIGGFFLGPRSTDFTANSGQFPVLARPFFNVNINQQFSELVALPGVTTGSAIINAPSDFWGAEANLRHKLCCGCNWQVNALAGFRYIDLDESIKITEIIQGLPTAPAPFTNQAITVFDRFATHNQFYGGQIGIDGRYAWGRWSIDGRAKLGLGENEQTLDIAGGQRFVGPDGVVSVSRGGLLALPSNIGHFTRSRFSLVPEFTLSLGYQFSPHVRGFIGYNYLLWTNVIRPGDQIDPLLNVQHIPNFPTNAPPTNLNHPIVPFRQSDFWAQGLNFGLEFTW